MDPENIEVQRARAPALSALTPVYTVGDQIAEAITTHQNVNRNVARNRAVELLDLVGIPNAAVRARSFPHEFSGGMRQRVMIAMAIANDPDLIIADEPTTALDVTIQAQILDVFKTAKDATGAGIILITHVMAQAFAVADRIVVLRHGVVAGDLPTHSTTPDEVVHLITGGIERIGQPQQGAPA